MRLDVVTPKGTLLEVQVDEVTAPGVLGEFGVLPGHIPFLTGVRAGVLHWRGPAGTGAAAVGTGYAEIHGETIVVLADSGVLAEKIDAAAVTAELAGLVEKIKAHSDDAGVRASLEADRSWAEARLAAVAQLRAPAAH